MQDKVIRLLLIEDDKVDQMAFARFVKSENLPYDYTIASSVAETREVVKSNSFDVIIADYMLGDGTSFELFDQFEGVPVIVTTGSGNEDVAVEAMKLGACDYLIKDPEGCYLKTLPTTVELALKRKQNEKELRNYHKRLESMVEERTAALQAEIVERKQIQNELEQSKNQLQLAIEGSDLGMWDWDMHTNYLYFSPKYVSMLGYGPKELLPSLSTWENLLHPDDRESTKQEIQTSIEKGSGKWSIEFRLRNKDGQYSWILGRGKVVKFSQDGVPLRAAGTQLDITDRKQAEMKLLQSESKFRAMMEAMSDPVYICSEDYRIEYMNPAMITRSGSNAIGEF